MNWRDEQIEHLIMFYSQNSFLYNPECADYHNRTKRRLFLETLAKELGTNGRHGKHTTIVVVCKFVNLIIVAKCAELGLIITVLST